jgi:hypothetical protein
VPFNQVLQFYAIERFLSRLSRSPHVDGVLLKGALLLKTVGIPRARPTLDIDLLRQGSADRASLVALVRDCALIEDASDGVTFDCERMAVEDITKDAEYHGTRVQIPARMDNVRLNVQIDFGVGDIVVPRPRLIEYPVFLGQPPLRLRAYPIETAIAEKFQAMVERDLTNSRMKDFYDIWVCSRHLEFEGSVLAESLAATFERRATRLPWEMPPAFSLDYFGAKTHQLQWQAFVKRIGEAALVDRFPEIVAGVADFIMPAATSTARGLPFRLRWLAGGPWRERS